MSNIQSIIASFVGQSNVLVINTHVLKFFGGNFDVAAMFSQLFYWSDKTDDPDGWIFKSAEDWYNELCLSKYRSTQARKGLEKIGLIETEIHRIGTAPTCHYRVNVEKFIEDFEAFLSEQKKQGKQKENAHKKGNPPESKKTALSESEKTELSKNVKVKKVDIPKVKELNFQKGKKLNFPIQNTEITTETTYRDDHGGEKSKNPPPEKPAPRKKSRAAIFRTFKPDLTEQAKEVLAELSRLTNIDYSPKDVNIFEPVYYTIRDGYKKHDLITMMRFLARDKFKRKALSMRLFSLFEKTKLAAYIAQAKAATQRSCDSQISMESLAANAALVVSD